MTFSCACWLRFAVHFQTLRAGLVYFAPIFISSDVAEFNMPMWRPRPPLWSSSQSSWLQIQRSRVQFPGTTKKVVGLERGPPSLVSTAEELLDRKVAAPV
jgi:hypothetical protein